MHTKEGTTLIELVVALSIVAILALVAVPAFTNLIEQHAIHSAGRDLYRAFNTTRSTAIMRRRPVGLSNLDGDWSSGMAIFIDDNTNGTFDKGEDLLRRFGGSSNVSTTGNYWLSDYVLFRPDGSAKAASGAFQAGSVSVCKAGVENGYKLVLSIGGRVRMETANFKSCPMK